MDATELYTKLCPIQESKGYFFSNDKKMVFELLSGLLQNKERYGYMACPCRLANGIREADADIICPCIYREADVAEYGSCYCALYVSAAWNTMEAPQQPIPERRPADKII